MPKTANEALYDATIRHQIKVLRYSEGQANAVSKLLKAADSELAKLLKTDLTETSEARVKAVLKDIKKQREAMSEAVGKTIKKDILELAGNESEWELEAIKASCPVELKLSSVNSATLKALTGKPINGVPLEGWLGSMKAGDVSRIEQQLRLGIVEGQTTDQLVKRIRGSKAGNYEDGITNITRRNAQTIARTATNHISNAARQETWNANSDIIMGIRWVATLDGRTSDVCRGRDGQVYDIDKGPRPPAHPGCRSTTVPILDGDEIVGDRPFVRDSRTKEKREVDFKAEAQQAAGPEWKHMNAKQKNAAVKAKRDDWSAKNIGQVPSSQTYDSWLRNQPKEFQNEILGDAKAELFRKGLTLDKFIDEKGKPYTLAQLKAETSQDKLNVAQPGVGMKAKALIQQGLPNDEVLKQIKAEYPEANTSAASLASYKTELKKAGALDQLVGQLPSGGIKQAKAVADVVSNLEASLPPGIKHSIGGQWATVVEDLDGPPGVYAHYEAGKGVQLSGKKLAAVSQQQAQQVAAHELGHLLHKQHDLTFSGAILTSLATSLAGPDKKLYGYYLSHLDELTAEVYAQALSPSPLTSQGLSAIVFNQVFGPAIDATKKNILEKFPVPPPTAPPPLQGGPTAPFEVAGTHTTVGGLAKALLQQGLPDDQVLKAVMAQFPDAKTSKASLASYKVELKKKGLLPSKGAGPVVTAKNVPLPLQSEVPATGPIPITQKTMVQEGVNLLANGATAGDVYFHLQKKYPGAPWGTITSKAEEAFKTQKAGKPYLKAVQDSIPVLPVPKLAGVPLGQVSSQLLVKLKTHLGSGGDMAGAHHILKTVFGSTYKEAAGKDLIDLAQYELATGKQVAKPFTAAAGYTTADLAAVAAKKLKAAAEKAALLQVNMTPTRLAASPREGLPPPPRFNAEQRRAAVIGYDGQVDTKTLSAANAEQARLGLPLLTPEEFGAVRAYTGGLYRMVNDKLRGSAYTGDLVLQAFIEAAQHGLAKMPKFKGLTSRGITQLTAPQLKNMLEVYIPGTIVEDNAFISSSAGERAAFSGRVYHRIIGKTGVYVDPYSRHPGEREVLYSPGTRFRVLKVTKTPTDTYIIDMEEV